MDAVVGVVVDYTVKPVLHQLDYLFRYNGNIEELEKKLGTLQTTRETVQSLVSQDKGKGNAIFAGVTKWLDNVMEVLDMPQQSDGGSTSSNPSCFNFVKRHQLSRKAKKRVEYILELINDGKQFNKDNVGYPVPSPYTNSPTLPADYQTLDSRTLMSEKIKDALADPNVNKVGVCGMGGVGKTSLLNEVQKLVLENNLFDRVIQVEVGNSKSVIEIQETIRGILHMELDMQCDPKVRASRLQTQIVERKENILIMLDDLWEECDFEKVGIPFRSELRKEGCKILMTSRSQDVLTNQMNTERLFEVNSLSDEESWKFFVAIVGEESFQDDIQCIARDVVKRCGGLPIALKTIAKTLKRKKVHVWKDALKKLLNPVSVDIQGVSDELYTCLKISYDSIEDEAKLLFRLCSVFPDDHVILMKDLQKYAMGMGLLNNDINNWEDARVRVLRLVTDLKSSYLLLESNIGDNYVKMHDVVRDVAKYIASKIDKMPSLTYGRGQISEWLEVDRSVSYNAIFVDFEDILNLPPKLDFPNLQLFILTINEPWKSKNRKIMQIPDGFFQGMEDLRVLDMTDMRFEASRTLFTHSLKNLQTLCMSNCGCNGIDTIGQLKKLKILEINHCKIQELPETMSELTQLKVLNVLGWLRVIPPNIISRMTKLEELSLWFKGWGEEISYKKIKNNVKLSELNCLTSLSCLSLKIQNVDILSDGLSSERARKLEEFFISAGHRSTFGPTFLKMPDWRRKISYGQYARRLSLDINYLPIHPIGGAFEILLQKCEELKVKDSVGFTKLLCNPDGNYGYPYLKHLEIYMDGNSDMPPRIGNITPLFDLQGSFPELKHLIIEGENNLETLWHNNGLSANSFCKLQIICIDCCNKLTHVFPSHMVTSLVFLNVLQVSNCELLERIFEIEEPIDGDAKASSSTMLELNGLPNLKHVWNSDHDELLTFPNLKEVNVVKCHQLKCLFPSHKVTSLVSLNTLVVENCELLERIFEIEELTDDDAKVVSLTMLELCGLPNLKHVWNNDPSELLTFPNLKNVKVEKCPRLKSLFPTSFIKHMKIERLYADEENKIFAEDEASRLVFPEIVLFPSVRFLTIHCKLLVKKRSFWHKSESFPKLEVLHLIGLENDGMVSLPLEMRELLYRVEQIQIKKAFELVQVFQNGDQENNHNQSRRAKLKRLNLYDLHNLTQVWEYNTDHQMTTSCFDSLEYIVVEECENLKCLLPSSFTFFNLTSLEVNNCNGMTNLFSFSVAKNVVNLRRMTIRDCEGMSSIVVADEGGGEREEEKVEEIIFNRMNCLRLNNLPRLGSFHSGKCTLKFPCLEELYIAKCPEMKTFSYGKISTPKLQHVKTAEEEVRVWPTHDINVINQHIWKDEIVISIKNLFTQQGEEDIEEDNEE